MLFYVGLHHPHVAGNFERAFISVNRLRERKSDFPAQSWIMDSGAFSEISTHGHYRQPVEEYAEQINRWRTVGNMEAAVTQDYMCELFILEKTGLSVREHQDRTILRYYSLLSLTPAYVMPVLQGYQPHEYVEHIGFYGGLLTRGAWVGVGSVCKRNASVEAIEDVLIGIKRVRPDLRLHGFGLKTTALRSVTVRNLLHSADSMAWSFAARREGRNANCWREAKAFEQRINSQTLYPFPRQLEFAP